MAAEPGESYIRRSFDASMRAKSPAEAAGLIDGEYDYIEQQTPRWLELLGVQLPPFDTARYDSDKEYDDAVGKAIEKLAYSLSVRDNLLRAHNNFTPANWQFLTEFFGVPFESSANELTRAVSERRECMYAWDLMANFGVTCSDAAQEPTSTELVSNQVATILVAYILSLNNPQR